MKFGKSKLKKILSAETGIPVPDITIHGGYKCYGNKEQIIIGGHTITAVNGRITICEPVIRGENITYKGREIKRAPM